MCPKNVKKERLPIGTSVKGSFGDKKAKTRLSRDARTEGTLTFPRSLFTFISSKTAALSYFAEVPIALPKRSQVSPFSPKRQEVVVGRSFLDWNLFEKTIYWSVVT